MKTPKILLVVIVALGIATPVFPLEMFMSGGIASWYGGGEALNECTANGEIFCSDEMTCATWYYPFNTMLKVTNIKNGKSVVVRVNDRGPNKRLNRAIDLTRSAFLEIGDLEAGLIEVKIEMAV